MSTLHVHVNIVIMLYNNNVFYTMYIGKDIIIMNMHMII